VVQHGSGVEKRRVLIVGGLGFIGSNLASRFVRGGWDVRVLDVRRQPLLPIAPAVEVQEGDYENHGTLSAAMEGVDVVCHLASTTVPGTSVADPAYDVSTNLVPSVHLLDTCVRQGVKRVLFISSGGTVYGPDVRVPTSEDEPTNPICSYGVVKLAVEKYIWMYGHLHGLRGTILRVSNPYGPGQYPFGKQGAVAVVLGCLASGRPFHLWGDGSVIRDYIFIADVADACFAAAEFEDGAPLTSTFNVSSGQGTSLKELISLAEDVTQRRLEIIAEETRNIDVKESILDCERARSGLGWEPQVSLRSGIERTWDWLSEMLSESLTS